jgi:integrase
MPRFEAHGGDGRTRGRHSGPRVMQERLGHGSIAITLGTYSHVLPEMDAAAADRIAEVAT